MKTARTPLSQRPAVAAREPAAGEAPAHEPAILIADDDALVRTVVRLTLEGSCRRFFEASSGPEALQICRTRAPDLAILDWRMPGTTGVEVVEALREDPATAGIATILLTAYGDSSRLRRGRSAGVRAFLVKPFSPIQLCRAVDQVLSPEAPSSRSAIPESKDGGA